jgi:hypothetical protein
MYCYYHWSSSRNTFFAPPAGVTSGITITSPATTYCACFPIISSCPMRFFGGIVSLRETPVALSHSPGDANHANHLLGRFRVKLSGLQDFGSIRAEGNRAPVYVLCSTAHGFEHSSLLSPKALLFLFGFHLLNFRDTCLIGTASSADHGMSVARSFLVS